MLETNIESLKTKLGQVLLPVVNDVISGINSMIEALTGNKKETVLDRFAAIDLKKEEKIASIEATAEEARTLTEVLEGIGGKISTNKTEAGKMLDNVPDGKSGKLKTLGDELDSIETQADDNKKAIGGMTDTAPDGTNLDPTKQALTGIQEEAGKAASAIEGTISPAGLADDEYKLWLETCDRLVKTIPGLSEIINTQTGEIKGGTEAVRAYINAWEEGQKGLALRSAHQQKGAALESYAAELPGLELDKVVAERRVRKARDQINGLIEKYGLEGYTADTLSNFEPGSAWAEEKGLDYDSAKELSGELKYYQTLKGNAIEATNAYEEQKQAYDEAVAAYEEEGNAIEETYGSAIEALGEWSDEQKEAASQMIANLDEALQAMKAYEDEVRKATRAQIDSNVSGSHGFNVMKTAATMAAEAAGSYEEYAKALGDAAVTEDEWLKIHKDGANDQITAQSMVDALDSQLEFINEYKQNLEDVKNTGLIDDKILSQLSDGSTESAQYLHAMAEAARAGDTAALEKINKAWEKVEAGKEQFTDTLTQQKLAVDETYDAMVAKAQEAAKALDVSGDAGASTGKNIQAMAEAIKSHVPEVATQVDAILSELNRLNSWGVNIDLGGFGSFSMNFGNVVDGKHATGLNYVPFDGYLAQLHEGEGILTAEENRIWQAFKNGQRGVDYDQLGGIMRDSIKPGGDVYLDGRVVGAVVSQMQGNQYRTMQRSGWQS